MYEISVGMGQLLVVLGWLMFRGIAAWKRKKLDWKQEARQLLILVNLMVIYRMTFHPLARADGRVQPLIFDPAAAWPFRVNWVPLVNLLDYETGKDLLLNLIGNFAMFIPTGILMPLIYRNLDGGKKILLTGFLISLTIEILQMPFAVRCSDVDDLILNTLGCLAGYGILNWVRWVCGKPGKN